MAVPKPPNFDAVAWRDRLKEAIPKRPDGTPITVWSQLPDFIQWARTMRDVSNTHDIQLADHKKDLDNHTDRLNIQADRIKALEDAPTTRPFP